jgi:NitT/TauT family transport system substrate-binding protein
MRSFTFTPAPGALVAKDDATGKAITDGTRSAALWFEGESHVRHFAPPEAAFGAKLRQDAEGRKIRTAYAQDRTSGIKLFADRVWYASSQSGQLDAFLLKADAGNVAVKFAGQVHHFSALSRLWQSPHKDP